MRPAPSYNPSMAVRSKSVVRIVTPGTRRENNGNWRTAARWASMLRGECRIIVQSEWDGEPADALVALHAVKSAPSIAAWRARSNAPLALVLTGTDLYRDLPKSATARASLDAADRLVVLQDDAPRLLVSRWRAKCDVIFQSATPLARVAKPRDRIHAVAVGHLRDEKDPATLFAAMKQLPAALPLTLSHIGAGLDASLARAARALAKREPRYRYLGALPHGLARAAIKRAHVLVHPSRVEGGANVIAEAVAGGTAVLASRMSGNVGMLGRSYPGYFETGDASGLASRLVHLCEDDRYLARLSRACGERARLFRPAEEARRVRALVRGLLV